MRTASWIVGVVYLCYPRVASQVRREVPGINEEGFVSSGLSWPPSPSRRTRAEATRSTGTDQRRGRP